MAKAKKQVAVNEATADEYAGELRMVPLADLQKVNTNLPKPDPGEINDLAESIEEVGILLQPIVVGPDLRIIAGRKRFAVVSKLDWDEVPVNVVPLDGVKAKLAEVDENLRRRQYTKLEFAELVEERTRLMIQLHPELEDKSPQATGKRGAEIKKAVKEKKPLPEKIANLTKTLAKSTGRSERSVQRDLARSSNIAKPVRDILKDTDLADNGLYLDKLGKLTKEEQVEAVGDGSGDIRLRIDRAVNTKKAVEEQATAKKKGGKPSRSYLTIKSVSMRLTEEASDIIASVHPKDLDAVVAEYESILEFVKQQVEARRPEEGDEDLAESFE